MKKFGRKLTMFLVLVMVFALACPAGLVYADAEPAADEIVEEHAADDSVTEETVLKALAIKEPAAEEPVVEEPVVEEPAAEEPAAGEPVVEEVFAEESMEESADENEQSGSTLTIVYDVVETKAKGSLYGELPSVVGDGEQQVDGAGTVTISDIDAASYQTFTGNEKDRFPYYSYAFEGWMTESGEIVSAGSEVAAESLDADGDGKAVLTSAWSGSWESGTGTPFAKFSLWTNAMSANACIESGALLGESVSNYTPAVGGSIMVALDEEGNTVTPNHLTSPSSGGAGHKNVGDIYNDPELNFKENNQGKYMMISYMGSSINQADEHIRALASTGYHTDDSDSGDITWKLIDLPSDEDVLERVSSFVSRGMTTMRDENGQKIQAEALTADNYAVRWCQVKYQSGKNDGWNINGVLSTKAKIVQEAISEIIKNEPVVEEPVVEEPVVEEPVVEEPVVEEPVVEEPVVEEPAVEEPAVEEPAVEEPAVEEPVVEEPAIEEPVVEEPIVEEPIVEEPVVEEPAVEEPVVEEPVVEEPAVEEPVVEEPVVEEPAVEEPAVEEPVVEEPVVEEPAVEEPAVEEPAVEEPVIGRGAISAAPASSEVSDAPVVLGGSKGRQAVALASGKIEYPAAPVVEEILDSETPLSAAVAEIESSGSHWALLNLLLLGLSGYVFLPVLTLRSKIERVRKLAENGRFAFAMEAAIVTLALLAFISTQDLGAPMVIVDALTLPMAFLSTVLAAIEYSMRKAESSSRADA